jgi:hypothetical protein
MATAPIGDGTLICGARIGSGARIRGSARVRSTPIAAASVDRTAASAAAPDRRARRRVLNAHIETRPASASPSSPHASGDQRQRGETARVPQGIRRRGRRLTSRAA